MPNFAINCIRRLVLEAATTGTRSSERTFATSQSCRSAQTWHKSEPKAREGVLKHRKCLVTGGSSGIGLAATKALIQNGAAAVTIVTRNTAAAQRKLDQLKHDHGLDLEIGLIKHDFEQDQSFADDLLKTDRSPNGPPFNTLINCAGISQTHLLVRTPDEAIRKLLAVNLGAAISLSRSFLQAYMIHGRQLDKNASDEETQPKSFCVVNVSSLLAERGGEGSTVYAASKAGLIAFTRALALEAAAAQQKYASLPPFRANVVVPGYIASPMTDGFSPKHKGKVIEQIPLRRFGTTDEVAQAMVFLLQNEYANNTVLNLDGGLSAH